MTAPATRYSLTVTAGTGTLTFGGTVGATELASLAVTGPTTLDGSVTTGGNQTYNTAVTIGGNDTLTTTGANSPPPALSTAPATRSQPDRQRRHRHLRQHRNGRRHGELAHQPHTCGTTAPTTLDGSVITTGGR